MRAGAIAAAWLCVFNAAARCEGADFVFPKAAQPVAEKSLKDPTFSFSEQRPGAFSRDGKRLYMGEYARHSVEIATGNWQKFLTPSPNQFFSISSFAVSPDDRSVVVTGERGEVYLATPAQSDKLRSLDESVNYHPFRSAVFLDGRRCLLGAGELPQDKTRALFVWDVESGEEIEVWPLETKLPLERIEVLAATRGGQMVACSLNGEITLLDGTNGRGRRTLTQLPAMRPGPLRSGAPLCRAAFSFGGRYLALGTEEGVRLFDVLTATELPPLAAHGGLVKAVRFSPDGKWLWSYGADRRVLTWPVVEILQPAAIDDQPLSPADLAKTLDMAGGEDAWEQFVAAKIVAKHPQGVLDALREQVKPVPALDAARLGELTTRLSAEDYNTRLRAAREVGDHGEQVLDALINVPKQLPEGIDIHAARVKAWSSLRDRRRLGIYQRYPTPEQQRTARLVRLLQALGTAEAKAHVEQLAAGYSGSILAIRAAEALRTWPAPSSTGESERPSWQQTLGQLSGDDARLAFQAIGRIALAWEENKAAVREEILRLARQPGLSDPAKHIAELVAQLDAADFAAREAATKRLLQLGRAREPKLRKALDAATMPEIKTRLTTVLANLGESHLDTDQRTALRLIEAARLSDADIAELWNAIEREANSPWLKQAFVR